MGPNGSEQLVLGTIIIYYLPSPYRGHGPVHLMGRAACCGDLANLPQHIQSLYPPYTSRGLGGCGDEGLEDWRLWE